MIEKILRFSIVFVILSLLGCAHTYVGDGGKASPDKKYEIYMVCHGRSAHAYIDYTVKKAFIGIYDKKRTDKSMLFSKWAILKATDLSWKYTWNEPQIIRIDFYEGKYSGGEKPCGFVLIKKDEATSEFKIADHSDNINFEDKVYFF